MASWRRVTGAAGVIAGAAAAGAGAVVAAERIAVARIRGRSDPESAEPFGRLRGRPLTVLTEDGVALHVEINGPSAAPVTVVFCHGYTLNQDCWHFQRRDLSEPPARLLGSARPRAVRALGVRRRQHRPARRRPEGGHRRGHARRCPGRPGRPLHGRHDHHGARAAAPGAVRDQGGRGGAHQHRRPRPGQRQPMDACPDPAAAEPGAASGAQRRRQGQARHAGGAQPAA